MTVKMILPIPAFSASEDLVVRLAIDLWYGSEIYSIKVRSTVARYMIETEYFDQTIYKRLNEMRVFTKWSSTQREDHTRYYRNDGDKDG